MSTRMAAVDAQFYWMSAKIPNDQFLLYAFDGVPADLQRATDEIAAQARACPSLTIRVDDGCALTYPRWIPMGITPEHTLLHETHGWRDCLDAAVQLAEDQLDARRTPWRMHLFPGVQGIPGGTGAGSVAVLQVAHALADGSRASALAGWLFGRAAAVPDVNAPRRGFLPLLALDAARTHRQLVRDTEAGLLGRPVEPQPALTTNARPAGGRALRTVVRHRSQLVGPTVTVAVLAAVSAALSGYLGDEADALNAEVPMAKPGAPQAHNHFRNVTIRLYPGLSHEARTKRIMADLAGARRRAGHVAARSADRSFAAVPAALLRWGVAQFDPDVRPTMVSGNTVVSSVDRGPADLHFGDVPVLLTAGYPALSPAMGLTHGVHGIGDTVAISIHAAESAIADIDAYARRLDAEL